jgi:acyl carrier protein
MAKRIEAFVRQSFEVAPDDPRFGREVDLFEDGYVDSIGLTELLAFIEDEFGIEVPDDELASDEFMTIDGMAGILDRLADR